MSTMARIPSQGLRTPDHRVAYFRYVRILFVDYPWVTLERGHPCRGLSLPADEASAVSATLTRYLFPLLSTFAQGPLPLSQPLIGREEKHDTLTVKRQGPELDRQRRWVPGKVAWFICLPRRWALGPTVWVHLCLMLFGLRLHRVYRASWNCLLETLRWN